MSHIPFLKPAAFTGLSEAFYRYIAPDPLNRPYWVAKNIPLGEQLGFPADNWDEGMLHYLGGSAAHYDPAPFATVYSGHQFGGYTPQLGDGRALLIGESQDAEGKGWEWQLKGAGKTPFSRFADGRAVLRSSIREYLCSEAMHGLGIPTTRALAIVGSDDAVYREQQETAAVVTRIAPSFIRFGHFEYFYHTGQHQYLAPLADFLIERHYPECKQAENPYLALFEAMCERSARLVADWQAVGFTHGVLNTDNMSVLGLTIDYGPFGFMDTFDRRYVPNHSDTGGRYAYNEQPYIVQWNLSRAGSAFLPLCDKEGLVAALDRFPEQYRQAYLKNMRAKLGLSEAKESDSELIADLLELLQGRADFTLFFRYLSEVGNVHDDPLPQRLTGLFAEDAQRPLQLWIGRYRQRLRAENNGHEARRERMNAANPLYVLRNYLAEQAIRLAQAGDYREIERLRECLSEPFTEQPRFADFAGVPPEWASEICLSCSS